MTTLEILKDARKRIETPERWCKNAFGYDINNYPVSFLNVHQAVRWCVYGSIYASTLNPTNRNKAINALECVVLEKTNSHSCIHVYNDNQERTHADILALFDKAIMNVEEEEKTEKGENKSCLT